MPGAGNRKIRIALIAGEASGDLLGAHLLKALASSLGDFEAYGIGGPRMQSEGMQSWYPMEWFAVRGYVEVLKSLPRLIRVRREIKRRLLQDPPDLFIGIDAPDFNLRLERTLRARGIETVHYVSPSIWAWRGERIHQIKRSASKVLALFPFEKPIYEQAGVPVHYVGHPLADEIPEVPDRAAAREQMRLSPRRTVVALLPGSRQSEVRLMGELFVATAKKLSEQNSDIQFLVPLVSRETRMIFEEAIYRQQGEHLPMTVLFGHAQVAMTAADVVLAASGTVTLEAALLKRPMVISYRVSRLSAWLMRRKAYLPYVGLPNILAGEFIVPEFLQEEATPDNLAQALGNLIADKNVRARLEEKFLAIHRTLRQGAAARAVEAILPLLGSHAQAAAPAISQSAGMRLGA
ncbi:MAG: lipid-A-disaccharide synthase [Burkholderiales bacterium]